MSDCIDPAVSAQVRPIIQSPTGPSYRNEWLEKPGQVRIFQQHDGEARAMVLIELLSKPQSISVNLHDLRPAG
jgi:hypothetical protein